LSQLVLSDNPQFKAMFTCDVAESKQDRMVLLKKEVLSYILYMSVITLTNELQNEWERYLIFQTPSDAICQGVFCFLKLLAQAAKGLMISMT
jgi:hypothetical protein